MAKRRTKGSVVILLAMGTVLFLPSLIGTGHADTCGGALTVNGTNCMSVGGVVLVSSPTGTQGCADDTGCVSQKPGAAPEFKPQQAPAPTTITQKPQPKPLAPVHIAPKPVAEVQPLHAPRSFDDREFYTGTYSKSLPYLPNRVEIGASRAETNTFTVSPSASSTLTFDRRSITSLVAAIMLLGIAVSLRRILVTA